MGFWDTVKKAFGVTDFTEINPQQYKSQLTLSTPAVEKMYSSALGNLMRGSTVNTHNLMLANSAGQMPGGALSAAIARANEAVSTGLGKVGTNIEQLRMNALARYLGLQRQYDVDKMQHEYQNLANVGATLGALTSVITNGFSSGAFQNLFGGGQTEAASGNNIGVHLSPQNLSILKLVGGGL